MVRKARQAKAKARRDGPSQPQEPVSQAVADQQRRRELLRERFPPAAARVAILEKLVTLQQVRGGEFAPRFVFMHMPDYILNVRRIGEVDIFNMTVAVEVYEHNDIVPGIVWIPLDHIWWIGTTDEPCGVEQLGLRSKDDGAAPDAPYQAARLKLAGLQPRT
ncbi:MAG: hypothetical protein NTW87_24490 [Planctomycetota bacterium]|nr:hypothetical protein [Planctomycetota bacterium]